MKAKVIYIAASLAMVLGLLPMTAVFADPETHQPPAKAATPEDSLATLGQVKFELRAAQDAETRYIEQFKKIAEISRRGDFSRLEKLPATATAVKEAMLEMHNWGQQLLSRHEVFQAAATEYRRKAQRIPQMTAGIISGAKRENEELGDSTSLRLVIKFAEAYNGRLTKAPAQIDDLVGKVNSEMSLIRREVAGLRKAVDLLEALETFNPEDLADFAKQVETWQKEFKKLVNVLQKLGSEIQEPTAPTDRQGTLPESPLAPTLPTANKVQP